MSATELKAVIGLGRIFTAELLARAETLPAGSDVYDRGGLRLNRHVAVLVDHDPSRPIGYVRELATFEGADGPWVTARAIITAPPSWLRRGSAASVCYAATFKRELGPATHVRHGLVREVSVLSAACRPANPGAQLLLLEEIADAPKIEPMAPPPTPLEYPMTLGALYEQHFGRAAPAAAYAVGSLDRPPQDGLLIRPALGQVVGVR